MSLTFGSVCSGIEAASDAWHPLGWRTSFLSEIAPLPRAVLRHHYPDLPLHSDFTTIEAHHYDPIDVLVGGTPCQAFSIAGLRGGLADNRGNLALQFLRLADRLRPRWLVWENVPGVLSSRRGRDFGAILGGLVELGYGFAYRVLDAQYFGVPQRRRRVFVIGHLGGAWQRAAAVLFEPESLRGDFAPGCATRKEAARAARHRAARGESPRAVTGAVSAKWAKGSGGPSGDEAYNLVAACHLAQVTSPGNRSGVHHERCTTLPAEAKAPVLFDARASGTRGFGVGAIAPALRSMSNDASHANDGSHLAIAYPIDTPFGWMVRRLTPRECERLQGFPDDYTLVPCRGKLAADGPRYKAIGNSMAVPVMSRLGQYLQLADGLLEGAP